MNDGENIQGELLQDAKKMLQTFDVKKEVLSSELMAEKRTQLLCSQKHLAKHLNFGTIGSGLRQSEVKIKFDPKKMHEEIKRDCGQIYKKPRELMKPLKLENNPKNKVLNLPMESQRADRTEAGFNYQRMKDQSKLVSQMIQVQYEKKLWRKRSVVPSLRGSFASSGLNGTAMSSRDDIILITPTLKVIASARENKGKLISKDEFLMSSSKKIREHNSNSPISLKHHRKNNSASQATTAGFLTRRSTMDQSKHCFLKTDLEQDRMNGEMDYLLKKCGTSKENNIFKFNTDRDLGSISRSLRKEIAILWSQTEKMGMAEPQKNDFKRFKALRAFKKELTSFLFGQIISPEKCFMALRDKWHQQKEKNGEKE